MNQVNNQVFIIDGSSGYGPGGFSQPVNASMGATPSARRIKKNTQQPVVDVIVVLVALPSLTILSLLLEANTRGNWLEQPETRFTVLGLGFALAVVCLSICIYVTSRVGGKMWSGAIPSDGTGPHYSYYNPRSTVDEMSDKPPSYEIVMGFDIPPPPYHTIIIQQDYKTDDDHGESCSKIIAIQHI